jgi:hypothetical protein
MMEAGGHLNREGLMEILQIAFRMNQGGIRRRISLEEILARLEPSETVRRTLTNVR